MEQKPEIASRFVTIEGKNTHYLAAGRPGHLNVVFLHGARFSSKDWLPVGCLKLASDRGYGAYALDLPGFGESESTVLNPHAFMAEFIREIGIASWILVGPSMGGQVALQCALAGLKGLVGLVLLAPAGVPALRQRLKDLDLPILLIWGDRDTVIPFSNAAIFGQETKKAQLVVLRGEGHTGYFNRPAAFNKALFEFLAEIAQSQPA